MKILYVCTGNTCRSPMAEFLTKEEATKRGLELEVTSGGLSAIPDSMSRHALEVLAELGIDGKTHRARPVRKEAVEEADLILTMTASHALFLAARYPGMPIYTLAGFAGEEGDVEDPYGGSKEKYRRVRDRIRRYIEIILDEEFAEKGHETEK